MELLSFEQFFLTLKFQSLSSEDKILALENYYNFLQQPITLEMLEGENKWFDSVKSSALGRTTYTVKGRCIFVEINEKINSKLEWLAGCGIQLLNYQFNKQNNIF